MTRVLVTGATGMIGRALIKGLREHDHEVIALTRRGGDAGLGKGVEVQQWSDPKTEPPPADALRRSDAVVHLLGEPIAQRWNDEVKREIRDSRVQSTRQLVQGLSALPAGEGPRVLISQSASGYYGARGDEVLEEDAPAGEDFLAGVVVEWEREARQLEGRLRIVCTRTGVVLAPGGGALAQMLPFFRLGIGGPVASGRQYVPWIALADVVGGIVRCLEDEGLSGAVNLTAPNPVTNRDLSKALGRALRRPAVLPVPGFALKLLYGEMAGILITGQRVVPARLQAASYTFLHPEIDGALGAALAR